MLLPPCLANGLTVTHLPNPQTHLNQKDGRRSGVLSQPIGALLPRKTLPKDERKLAMVTCTAPISPQCKSNQDISLHQLRRLKVSLMYHKYTLDKMESGHKENLHHDLTLLQRKQTCLCYKIKIIHFRVIMLCCSNR